MKRFHKLCAITLLTFMFAMPAMAGDMGAGGYTSDPPPPGYLGDPPPPGAKMAGDPEPPGDTGDPEPPGRMADQISFNLTVAFALALQGIFIG